MLNEPHPLRDLDLLLLRQLTRRPRYIWRRIIYRSIVLEEKTNDYVKMRCGRVIRSRVCLVSGIAGSPGFTTDGPMEVVSLAKRHKRFAYEND